MERESTVAWEDLPFPSWSLALLHLLPCLRQVSARIVPGDLLVPRAGWPLCPTTRPSMLFPVSPPRNAVVLMFTSVRPQRCQPFLPYLAYLDIYFLRLSVLRVAKPCWCPKQAASALREGSQEVEHRY